MATPPLFAKGVWVCKVPFDTRVSQTTSYTCIAIRSFQDVRNEGGDVYELYYKPVGLTLEQYQADDLAAVSIISITGEDRSTEHIPSNLITSWPVGTSNGYSRLIMAIEIGIVPNSIDFSYIKQEIIGLISDLTGLEATINMYQAPYTGVMDEQQAASFEANRQAAIKNRATMYAQNTQLQQQVAALQTANKQLTDILIESGVVVPTS